MFTPSPYQQTFFNELLHGHGDIQLVAVAGSGKTKSIEEGAKRLPFQMRQRTLMTAFNKHIERELTERQKRGDIPAGIRITTIHGFGYRVLRECLQPADARAWVEERKYDKLTSIWWDQQNLADRFDEATLDAVRATGEMVRLAQLTLTPPGNRDALCAMGAHFGVDLPGSKLEAILDAIPQILTWGREGLPFKDRDGLTYHPAERISFDDMVYLPVALNLPVPTFELCFIDEVQDFNRAQQELLFKARGSGRAVFVGDPAQSIYGFTGADADSFERIGRVSGAKVLPLSICYRCARSVVAKAQKLVPQIEAFEDAPEGVVVDIDQDKLAEMAYLHWRNPATRCQPFLILCRVNAPLIKLAFDLIGRGVPAKVKGRDIGAQLVKAIDAIGKLRLPNGDFYSFLELNKAAEQYRTIQVVTLSGRKNTEMQIASVHDRVDSILAIWGSARMRGIGDMGGLRAYVEDLFTNEDQAITLSSIHKAKGLEANKVGILRADLLPHPMAQQSWQVGQEKNLAYVAVTRARHELYIGWPSGSQPSGFLSSEGLFGKEGLL